MPFAEDAITGVKGDLSFAARLSKGKKAVLMSAKLKHKGHSGARLSRRGRTCRSLKDGRIVVGVAPQSRPSVSVVRRPIISLMSGDHLG